MIIEENSNKDSWSGKVAPKGTTIVIDGDWLAFVGACMTHVKHMVAIDISSGKELGAATSERALTKILMSLGRNIDDTISVVEEKRLLDDWEATAKGVMIGKANKIKRECGAQRILIAIGRKN